MRAIIALAAVLLTSAVAAQNSNRGAPAVGRRAPLAAVDDVEPAVNVGERRVAIIDRQIAQAPTSAPSQQSSGADQAQPPSATPPPSAGAAADKTVRTEPAPSEPAARRVVDTLDLGTTSITGNQELPKVLYIVPWKKSDLGDLVGRPVNTLLDEVLTPIDPDVFERHLKYYDSLYRQGEQE
jgi:hypothetical protein